MLNATDYRSCLSPTAHAHLRESCLALGERQFFAAAVWAAVFLEALLDDLAQAAGLPRPGQDDLNGRIQQLQQWSRNKGSGTLDIPDEIIKRCQDIRNTRNRLVHNTGTTKSTLAQDAEFIHAGLKVLLDWYQTVSRPHVEAPPLAPGPSRMPGVRVFISTITPHNSRQEYFLQELLERLRDIGIEPVRFVPTLYDRSDPIGKIRSVIESCRGVIILGLERTHTYFLRDKEGTPDQKDATHRKYTSGWLHLEAGIANALGRDAFVLCQQPIHSDGIFDRAWNTYPVAEIETLDVSSLAAEEFLRHLRGWAAAAEKSGVPAEN
jgi:hypothetical protein